MRSSLSDISENVAFGFRTGMRKRTFYRRADILRITPQRAGLVIIGARLPGLATLGQNSLIDLQIDCARFRVDADDVAIFNQRDRTAIRRFRANMTDTEAARRAGKAPVRDQRNAFTHTL